MMNISGMGRKELLTQLYLGKAQVGPIHIVLFARTLEM